MITALAARWLFTLVFAAAGLAAAQPRRGRPGAADPAGRVPAVFCVAMCASLIAMTWWSEPAAASRVQAAAFGCAALWFVLASLASYGRGRRPSLPALLHTLMAVAMIWMLTEMPAVSGMPSAGSARGTMAPMSRAPVTAPVLVISILLAVSCAATASWWLARAVGPGSAVKDPVPAGQAAMGAGMAAMMFAML
jgi:Domain of unknown function (DUF5134)